MSELKPCPCCGHKANLICEGSGSGKGGMQVCMTYYQIVCEFCNVKTSLERSESIATRLWNTRHQPVKVVYHPEKVNEIIQKYERLLNFIKQEIEMREYVCATNHAVLLDNARELLKELENG